MNIDKNAMPKHIGIIMDGNGRWAEKRGLPRKEGHKAGVEAFENICEYAAGLGIRALTFYAFSTENWKRPEQEISAIMELFRRKLDSTEQRGEENSEKRWRIRYIGDLGDDSPLPPDILRRLRDMEERSLDKEKMLVNIALNYGGRKEIVEAAKRLCRLCAAGALSPDEICEGDIEAGLYTAGQPCPDLIIRPSGELRLSNFLLWQAAYAELWFSDILWPDFSPEHLNLAIEDFARRKRRFGGV